MNPVRSKTPADFMRLITAFIREISMGLTPAKRKLWRIARPRRYCMTQQRKVVAGLQGLPKRWRAIVSKHRSRATKTDRCHEQDDRNLRKAATAMAIFCALQLNSHFISLVIDSPDACLTIERC